MFNPHHAPHYRCNAVFYFKDGADVSLADSVALLPKMNEFRQRVVTVINQF